MDHRHTLKRYGYSSSRWRHLSAKQTSEPQVMQGTSPNTDTSIASSLQPGTSESLKPKPAATEKYNSLLILTGTRRCPLYPEEVQVVHRQKSISEHAKTMASSLQPACLLSTQCGLCPYEVKSIVSEEVSIRAGIRMLVTLSSVMRSLQLTSHKRASYSQL